jgi:hypothetical protein
MILRGQKKDLGKILGPKNSNNKLHVGLLFVSIYYAHDHSKRISKHSS